MTGATVQPPTTAAGTFAGKGIGVGGAGKQLPLPDLISFVAERLSSHVQPGNRSDADAFYKLCIRFSQLIDFAIGTNEIPGKTQELSILFKQICRQKNDRKLLAAIMVLMMSVKNACKIGWFQRKDTEELLAIADEIQKSYYRMGNANEGFVNCTSTISTIMERFYPRMTVGEVLASLQVQPGYGGYAIDFYISKSTAHSPEDKVWLMVAQTDNMETSACIISPQQVNFLLNGKGVERRTNVMMDSGPQMPTNVTGMLKYGTNLLQAVGQFNGHYVILVAFMSGKSLTEKPVLQKYVQPPVMLADPDSDIIEESSRISLNCPIRFKRIKTPVKGHLCKHLQCFDFDNFIDINSKRPTWRCPHCNQPVCYADICIDQNMVEVLKNIGENVVEVIIRTDGSWKAVLANDDNVDRMRNKTSISPHAPLSSPATVDVFSAILSDAKRQQHFSQSLINSHQVPSMTSSASQHHSASQVWGPNIADSSAPSQLPNPYQPPQFLTQLQSPHLQQTLNPRATLPVDPSSSNMRLSNSQWSHLQQGSSKAAGATASSQQARVMEQSVPVQNQTSKKTTPCTVNQASKKATPCTADRFQGLAGDQRGHVGGTAESFSRPDGSSNLQPEQNWHPTRRMRGSLQGRQYSDDVENLIIKPSQSVQNVRPQAPPPALVPSARPQAPPQSLHHSVLRQLQALIANSSNAPNHPGSHNPSG